MIKTYLEKKTARVVFVCDGRTIPLLDRSFEFTTIRGAKAALIAVIRNSVDNLQRFYGYGKIIQAKAYLPGEITPFMTTTINI